MRLHHWLALLFILVVCTVVTESNASTFKPERLKSTRYTTQYDPWFEKYSKRHLPGYDWQWLKAICISESGLKPTAVSPVKAAGLCQFMPGTWKDVSRDLGLPASADVFNPELNIIAASYYMHKMQATWRAPRPIPDRKKLANASYNAGAGHLIKAQKRCGGVNLYDGIIACLPLITGHHSKETITYVKRIADVEKQLLFE